MTDQVEAYQEAVAHALSAIQDLGDHDVDDAFVETVLRIKALLIRQNVSAYIPIYRAREIRAVGEENRTSAYGPPPPEGCKVDGRAHIAGYPVFYGAIDQDTAIKEVLRTLGNDHTVTKLYVSKWWATREYNVLEFLYDDEVLQTESAKSINSRSLARLKEILAELPGSGADLLTVCRFVSKHFLDDNYTVSSKLSHSVLYSEKSAISEHVEVHGLWYPSVVKKHDGYNVAFTPDFVKESMSLRLVYEYLVKDNTDKGVRVSIKGVGMVDGARQVVMWFDVALREPEFRRIQCVIEGDFIVDIGEESVFCSGVHQSDATTVLNTVFKPVIADLAGYIGTIDVDIAPGSLIERPVSINLLEPLEVIHSGQRYSVKAINALVVLRPRFKQRNG
ncbi:MAG: RES family NAD+ phosphorylase [Flavobacteriales bacterium]|nr:RES family NAD+ phosphorylase [Flavobacteriales bacterium]